MSLALFFFKIALTTFFLWFHMNFKTVLFMGFLFFSFFFFLEGGSRNLHWTPSFPQKYIHGWLSKLMLLWRSEGWNLLFFHLVYVTFPNLLFELIKNSIELEMGGHCAMSIWFCDLLWDSTQLIRVLFSTSIYKNFELYYLILPFLFPLVLKSIKILCFDGH